MKRIKDSCKICNREISSSNLTKHEKSCYKKSIQKPKIKKSRTDIQLSIDPSIRKERAMKASRASQQKAREIKLDKLNNYPFNELSLVLKRERILIEQNYHCLECNISEIWNNKPLKFELDHIDGDRNNNERSNLRLICPNCHQQTPTYKSFNNKNPGKISYSDEEIINALFNNTSGYKAMISLGMNPHGGHYVRFRKIINDYKIKLNYTV